MHQLSDHIEVTCTMSGQTLADRDSAFVPEMGDNGSVSSRTSSCCWASAAAAAIDDAVDALCSKLT